ncbi:alpha/beta hydrolase [Chitinophaga sp.]|uniref:alpha/beta hydrolase n=1 Tax=Chitinophaga sp. TaxID=1869181 RepID=UPI0031D16AC2
MLKWFTTCSLLIATISAKGQFLIPLYKDSILNYKATNEKETIIGDPNCPDFYIKTIFPSLEIYFPDSSCNKKCGVLIIPGGAYKFLAYKDEGRKVGIWLSQHGITAFILKYRLPNDSLMLNKTIAPFQDAESAIKIIRLNNLKWHININSIGVMGFSAGGHLASYLATQFSNPSIPNLERINLRPDFCILIYPVISMKDSLTHLGTRNNLLGKNPSLENIEKYSNENYVTNNTPPTYLTHAKDDKLVTINNSLIFYQALLKNNVAAEMHLFPKGNHSFVLKLNEDEWLIPIMKWLTNGGWLNNN